MRDDVEFVMVPFGNARLVNKSVVCQHGTEECYGNAYHACTMDKYGLSTMMQLAYCMFNSVFYYKDTIVAKQVVFGRGERQFLFQFRSDNFWFQCAVSLKLNHSYLDSCARGAYGFQLILKMANKTDSLVPKHRWVPWTLVNNKYTHGNLYSYICTNYKRYVKACKKHWDQSALDTLGTYKNLEGVL